MIHDIIPMVGETDPFPPVLDTRCHLVLTDLYSYAEDHYNAGARIILPPGGLQRFKTIEKYGDWWIERLLVADGDPMSFISAGHIDPDTVFYPVQMKRYLGDTCQLIRPLGSIVEWHHWHNDPQFFPTIPTSYNSAVFSAISRTLNVDCHDFILLNDVCVEPMVDYGHLVHILQDVSKWEQALVFNQLLNMTPQQLVSFDPLTLIGINHARLIPQHMRYQTHCEYPCHVYSSPKLTVAEVDVDWSEGSDVEVFDTTCSKQFYQLIIYISALYYAELSAVVDRSTTTIYSANHPFLPAFPHHVGRIQQDLLALVAQWIDAKYGAIGYQVIINKTWNENLTIITKVYGHQGPAMEVTYHLDLHALALCTQLLL